MRYYSYNEYSPGHPSSDDSGGYVNTMSEYEIMKTYYPYWYEKMYQKFGREHVDEHYSFEDCLDDWIVIHWAWEVKE